MADENLSGIEAFIKGVPEPTPTQPEGVAEPVTEPAAEPAQPAEVQPQAVTETFFETFNKRTGASYKSDDEILESYKSLARTAEMEGKVKEMEAYKGKVDELTAAQQKWAEEKARLETQINPLSFFRDEQAYVAEQLRRQFPDKDPVAMERLMTSDLARMDKVELLAQKILLDTPDIDGGIDGAREAVLSDLGVDVGSKPEEWDRLTKNKLTMRANQAKHELEELKSRAQVEIPKVRTEADVQAEVAGRREALKTSWTPFLEKMEAIDKLQIPSEDGTVLTTIDIPTEWRKEMRAELMDTITASGLELNEDNITQLNALREMRFIHKNLPRLYKILENQWKSQSIEERDKLLNNTEPPNTSIKPEDRPDGSNSTEWRGFLDRF